MKLRPLGNTMLDLENVVSEMIEKHDLQHGDVLALVKAYMDIHFPESKEEYVDGTSPVYYYGHKNYVKKAK